MKNDFFRLPVAQQRIAVEQTAIKLTLPKQAVEKDLWVTAILQLVFSLPCADSLVFKGGTSLSKAWGLINRFSEDIDLAIDRSVFDYDGDLTKRQIKKLRKASSLFVKEELFSQLEEAIYNTPLKSLCRIEAQPDGEGDDTYPEPRRIMILYQSLFDDKIGYIAPVVLIEAGARSLLEPTEDVRITSMVEETFPTIETRISDIPVKTAIAEKTFLEKAFLLHELFSVSDNVAANRRSRHIYDLYMMMQKGIDAMAVRNDSLWKTIQHHRSILTSVQGVDYSADIRDRIRLVPPKESVESWKKDYEEMSSSMIYGARPVFDTLVAEMGKLENEFHFRGGEETAR